MFALITIGCVLSIIFTKSEESLIFASVFGFLFGWPILFLGYKTWVSYYDMEIYHNRFNGQNAITLFVNKPEKASYEAFKKRLADAIAGALKAEDDSTKEKQLAATVEEFLKLGLLSDTEALDLHQRIQRHYSPSEGPAPIGFGK